jgi:MFS family permease
LTYFVRRHVKESDEFLAAHKKAEETSEKISFSRLFETPRLAMQTLGLMVMTIVQIAGYFGLMNWLPSIVQKKQGLSVSGSSYWMIATIIGMSIGMLVFGTIMDKIGPRWAFGIFLLGSAVVVFAIVNVTSYWAMLLAGALTGFFSNGMFGGYGAVISQLYPTEIRSTANNLIMNTGRAIGGFSSVIIGLP